MSSRVGIGFDAHAFGGPGPVALGGITIPHDSGLEGHSDGDALLHALADAILGAAGLGSLGEHYPDTSEEWKGVASGTLLQRVGDMARRAGYELANADAVVIAEAPRLAAHRDAIRTRIAGILAVEPHRVSVRGTSSNGLGFAGRGEGIAAMAVVLLQKAES